MSGSLEATAVKETPIPPSELSSLPKEAQMHCDNNPEFNRRGAINIWEFPGKPLKHYDESAPRRGFRGQNLGTLKSCASITIADYAWSEVDQQFYVYVKSSNSADWLYAKVKPVEGWVGVDQVDLKP